MDYANIPTGPRLMPPIFTPRHPRLNQTNHWQPSLLADPGGFQVFHHQQLNRLNRKSDAATTLINKQQIIHTHTQVTLQLLEIGLIQSLVLLPFKTLITPFQPK